METLLLETDKDGVATLTLNRPDKMNAINVTMWRELAVAFGELGANPEVRVIVLRGSGNQAFAPGADIDEFDAWRLNEAKTREYDGIMRTALQAVDNCPKPIIAMIYGPCVGGGLELVAQADLRLCGTSGKFGVPINRLGMSMAYPELSCLLKLLRPQHVLEIMLEGGIMDAENALRIGVVNRVFPDEILEKETQGLALRIARAAPISALKHKKFIKRLAFDNRPLSSEEMNECYDFLNTADYREGVAAFREKRKPIFQGK